MTPHVHPEILFHNPLFIHRQFQRIFRSGDDLPLFQADALKGFPCQFVGELETLNGGIHLQVAGWRFQGLGQAFHRHLQIALQQEAAAQPYFRRAADVTAFTEGWGLYAEFLGEEMGFYRTPYERFGRLSYEMWRACRLVADTGMHWLGWSVDQARACFRDNSALAPHNIETELQRYVGWPGQATAYKIGEIRLRAIRTRAEAELDGRFDIRRFHDALLVDGPLPMALLDARMDRWIAEEKAGPAD